MAAVFAAMVTVVCRYDKHAETAVFAAMVTVFAGMTNTPRTRGGRVCCLNEWEPSAVKRDRRGGGWKGEKRERKGISRKAGEGMSGQQHISHSETYTTYLYIPAFPYRKTI